MLNTVVFDAAVSLTLLSATWLPHIVPERGFRPSPLDGDIFQGVDFRIQIPEHLGVELPAVRTPIEIELRVKHPSNNGGALFSVFRKEGVLAADGAVDLNLKVPLRFQFQQGRPQPLTEACGPCIMNLSTQTWQKETLLQVGK